MVAENMLRTNKSAVKVRLVKRVGKDDVADDMVDLSKLMKNAGDQPARQMHWATCCPHAAMVMEGGVPGAAGKALASATYKPGKP